MARINNQAVMQKLIDDLKLYPGTDIIPTELAEKILPVFNVNEQDVNVNIENDLKMKSSNIARYGTKSAAGSATIYTTPATGKFYLTNANISMRHSAGSVGNIAHLQVTIDGSVVEPLSYIKVSNTYPFCVAQSFANPIMIDAGTDIKLTNTGDGDISYCNIVGYTVA